MIKHALTLVGILLLALPTLAQTSLSPTYEIQRIGPETSEHETLRQRGVLQQVPADDILMLYEVPTGNGIFII